jgi:hypothetical protein
MTISSKPILKSALMSLVAAGTFAIAPAAWAGCGDITALKHASYLVDDRETPFLLVNDDQAPIVGMWSVRLTAGDTLVDFGYSQWHGDGTEIMNSGGRAPATANFCLGVWKRTGHATYHLNHIALGYENNLLVSRINVLEDVTLAPGGNTFSGTFTIDAYDPNSNALQGHVAGNITGERINP